MVVAFIALGLALGGTSYAVVKPGKNSVGTRQLRNSAVTAAKLKAGAVDSTKVRDDSLTGQDINESTLTAVPSAAQAAAADRAAVADSLAQVVYRTTTATLGPAPGNGTSSESDPTEARCPEGHRVIGGGIQLEDSMSQVDGFPSSGGTGWTGRAANDDVLAPHSFTVYAICVAAATIG
jgi:hypothetical protein